MTESNDITFPCTFCGYALYDPDVNGRCPECGHPIAPSIIENKKPRRQRNMARQFWYCVAAGVAVNLVLLAAIGIALVGRSPDMLSILETCVAYTALWNLALYPNILYIRIITLRKNPPRGSELAICLYAIMMVGSLAILFTV